MAGLINWHTKENQQVRRLPRHRRPLRRTKTTARKKTACRRVCAFVYSGYQACSLFYRGQKEYRALQQGL